MKNLVLVCFLILIKFLSFSQISELTPNPSVGRDDAIAFSIGTNGFLVTGNQGGFSESNKLWKYDSKENYWSEKAEFPGIERQYASCFTFDSKAYIIGGYSEFGQALNDMWEYNSITDSWTQKPNFPGFPHWGASACSFKKLGFVVGGTNGTEALTDVWSYDFFTEEWNKKADLPEGSREGTLIALANKISYVGGFAISPFECTAKYFHFNVQENLWSQGVDFPSINTSYLTGVSGVEKAYIASGWSCDNNFGNELWETDGETWILKDTFPENGIRGMSAFSINSIAYFLGGINSSNVRSNRMYSYGSENSNELISVYPNPFQNETTVFAPISSKIVCFDQLGKSVLTIENTISEQIVIELPIGFYFIQIENEEGIKLLKVSSL